METNQKKITVALSPGHLTKLNEGNYNKSKGEREIRLWIKENIITYIPQHRFNDCRNKNPLPSRL